MQQGTKRMSNELNGQLTSRWTIPLYARDALWLETDSGAVRADGEKGLFTLDAPTSMLTLRWSSVDGPALARLAWKAGNLEWDGTVRIGGYIDAIHLTEIPGVSFPITVIYMGGQPLKHDLVPYPTNTLRAHPPYRAPDFHSGLASELPESVTTWLVSNDSPLTVMAQDAMLNDLRLYLFGRLADDKSSWGTHFALPLLLEAITLFGP
jgi:hypothetical protein